MFECQSQGSGQNGDGLDGSDLELEFLSPMPSGMANFEPKRCSTPLSSAACSTTSWTECNSGRELDSMGDHTFENRHCVPNLEAEQQDYGGYGDRHGMRSAVSSPMMMSPVMVRQQSHFRRLPLAPSPLPTLFRPRGMPTKHLMVPEYPPSHTPSPSFMNAPPRYVAAPQNGHMQAMMSSMPAYGSHKENIYQQSVPSVEHVGTCGGRAMGCCGCTTAIQAPLQMEQYARVANFRGAHKSPAKDHRWSSESNVERQAQAYRLAASICEPTVVWSGILPAKNPKGSAYSCKVFLGGVPWDITEANLNAAFGKFGQLRVEWPSNYSENSGRNSKGYLYIIFDNERSVRALLSNCTMDANPSGGGRNYYYKVCSTRLRRKDVQVIPWPLSDSTYVHAGGCISMSGTKTVFVGSLHGMLNAEGLARIMNDLFGGVVTANIDTDKYKYPIGSGRVVFNCTQSYVKAIRAAFVEVRTQKFSKKIQIDPFLEDSVCSICAAQMGPYFCRDMECFNYFCGTCWQWQHSVDNLKHHTPMMRNPRSHDADY